MALAVDVIDRLRSGDGFPTDPESRVETATHVVAEALQLFDQAKGMRGEVPDSVATATESVEAESPDLFDPFVEGVAERLEADHDALLLALEWRTAFGIE